MIKGVLQKNQKKYTITKKTFLRGIVIGIVISFIVTFLSWMGFLRGWENGVFDFMIWWGKEKKSNDVIIIEIDGDDYHDVFNSLSPLSRKKLSEIILKIAKAQPKAIAIDINLSDDTAEDKYLIEAFQKLGELNVPVILPSEMEHKLPINSGNLLFGTIEYPISRDGVIREMFLVKDVGQKKSHPCLPLTILAATEGYTWKRFYEILSSHKKTNKNSQPRKGKLEAILKNGSHFPVQKIQYIGDKSSFNSFKSSFIFKISDRFFKSKNIFSDKIIIIGGTFEEARDFYMTPKGKMSGVEIIANSVETLLNARILKPINHLVEFLMEIAIILILSYYFLRFSAFKGTLIGLITILPLAIFGSFVAFSSLSRWLNFIPVGVSIILHGQVSFFEWYGELKKELIKLKSDLSEKENEISNLKHTIGDLQKMKEKEDKEVP